MLGIQISRFGGLAAPADGLGMIALDAQAVRERQREVALGLGVAKLRRT